MTRPWGRAVEPPPSTITDDEWHELRERAARTQLHAVDLSDEATARRRTQSQAYRAAERGEQ